MSNQSPSHHAPTLRLESHRWVTVKEFTSHARAVEYEESMLSLAGYTRISRGARRNWAVEVREDKSRLT